jgi:hypothetical protein
VSNNFKDMVFCAALNAVLGKKYDRMTSTFDESVILECIDHADKIVDLVEKNAKREEKNDKIAIAAANADKKPRGRPKVKSIG